MKKNFYSLIIITYIAISLILILSPLSIDLYTSLKGNYSIWDNKYKLNNYKNVPWAKKHFEEFKGLKISYFDYYIWRRNDFHGKTIRIKNGFRLNNNNEKFNLKKDIWVFGGSTIWGTGANNENTIPSLIEKITGISTLNLGETGYQTSQSLNLLVKNLVNHKPKKIIFYDGFNDVFHKCRSMNDYFQSAEESRIQELVNRNFFLYSENLLIGPEKFLRKLFVKSKSNEKKFNCNMNKDKALKIAKIFVENWLIAKSIADRHNINFIGVLQPTIFSSKSKKDNLDINHELEVHFKILYDMIKIELENKQFNYLNLENPFSNNENIFIDACHLSPNGNLEIAQKIINSRLF
mgnify:CR=1 FL=1